MACSLPTLCWFVTQRGELLLPLNRLSLLTYSVYSFYSFHPLLSCHVQVAAALNDIWQVPRHRPHLLFYDRSCFRRIHLQVHPDPTWGMTINITDRFVRLCSIRIFVVPISLFAVSRCLSSTYASIIHSVSTSIHRPPDLPSFPIKTHMRCYAGLLPRTGSCCAHDLVCAHPIHLPSHRCAVHPLQSNCSLERLCLVQFGVPLLRPYMSYRFHALNHRQHGCAPFCSPNRKDLNWLWRTDGTYEPVFRWNSARAESSNSILHGEFIRRRGFGLGRAGEIPQAARKKRKIYCVRGSKLGKPSMTYYFF